MTMIHIAAFLAGLSSVAVYELVKWWLLHQ